MEQLAQPLALRGAPDSQLIERALQLALVAEYDEDSHAALAELVEQQLAARTPGQFCAWLSALEREAESRGEADLREELERQVHKACEFAPAEGRAGVGHYLVALPWQVRDARPAWELALPADAGERVGAALKAHGVLAGDAQVRVLPRILPDTVAARLSYGIVYRAQRALAGGDAAAALALVEASMARLGGNSGRPAASAGADGVLSRGVVMALVTGSTVGAFPLKDALMEALQELELQGIAQSGRAAADAREAKARALLAEHDAVLQKAAASLAPWLGVPTLRLMGTAGGWFDEVAQLMA
jgi:hypothetical protein